MYRGRRRTLVLAVALALGIAASGAAPALGAFTRPFVDQIPGTPTGAGGANVPFGGVTPDEQGQAGINAAPGGIAADAQGGAWVGNVGLATDQLDELGPDGELVRSLARKPEQVSPASLAVSDTTDDLYVAGLTAHPEAGHVEVFNATGEPVTNSFPSFDTRIHVAVDNSTDPFDLSAGDVYVALEAGSTPGIEKFSATGEPLSFATIKKTEVPLAEGASMAIAVDGEGDIYVIDGFTSVDEYSSGGVFLRAITPGRLLRDTVAFDPAAGHVLVTAGEEAPGYTGAVYEYEPSGRLVGQVADVASPSKDATSCGVARAPFLRIPAEVAVNAQGRLFVSDTRGAIVVDDVEQSATCEHALDVYEPGVFLPGLTLAEASKRAPTSATLSGSVNPEGQPLDECLFEYVPQAQFEASGFEAVTAGEQAGCVPAAGAITGSSPTEVTAAISGLSAGVTYRFRLLATSSGALGGTSDSDTLAFTAPAAPRVESAAAANLSSTFAELRVLIDPLGAPTSYRFEYSSDGSSWTDTPIPDGEIGSGGPSGSASASVARQIGPLVPGTTYRFRVFAQNAFGTAPGGAGTEGTFTTLPAVAAGLPDGRAYELVTPADKGSAADMFSGASKAKNEFTNTDRGYASESGDAVLLTSSRASFGAFAASENNAYRFSRAASGWTNVSLASPLLGAQSLESDVFDPLDFSAVALNASVGSRSSSAGGALTDLLGPPGGPYTALHADAPAHTEPEQTERTEVVGASQDLSHVVLESKNHRLAPGAANQDEGSDALYEYSAGELRLVNVDSEGALLTRCGAILGLNHGAGSRFNAVSSDGSKIVFTAPDPFAEGAGCWNGGTIDAPQLYVRSGATSTEISAPQAGFTDPGCSPQRTPCDPAFYVGASATGSRIFFLTTGWLTEDHPESHDLELYEYDTETASLTRISAGEPGSPGAKAGAAMFAVPAVSEEGSAVYFLARGRLTADAPAVSGSLLDLYRYDTASATTAFVATVEEDDYPLVAIVSGSTGNSWKASGGIALSPSLSWYTTPDGRYLLFATAQEPTGYSSAEAAPGDCPGRGSAANGRCAEVYRYDSATASLECVSCNPSGAPPESNAEFAGNAGSLTDPAAGPVRAISDDGAYAFFATADALVPQDANGTQDVYEWHDGQISLISSGQDSYPSFFLGASADGSNVFFGTHANLIPSQNTESQGNLYDARICTEADPCIPPPPGETAQCEGGACQSVPPAPIDATPTSLTFSGAGDLAGRPAPSKHRTAAEVRAGALAKALKACKRKPKSKRAACERLARKRYAPPSRKGKR
jgi:hypothetical protein